MESNTGVVVNSDGQTKDKLDQQKIRKIQQVVKAVEMEEGQGARVKRSIGSSKLSNIDPFLLLDEFFVAPPAGFTDHPHRGFETVTYMIDGAFKHKDNKGHEGTIGPGDLQWMTAGRGVIHSEMPATPGVNHGLQLWVNLHSKDKMCDANYQELLKSDIPHAEKDGVKVIVIAGKSMDLEAKVRTRTPAYFLDFTLKPGSEYSQEIPTDFAGFLYILSGSGTFGDETAVPAGKCVVLANDGGNIVKMKNTDKTDELRLVLVVGQPLKEPVAKYGPFVMNTQDEIKQAIQDYHDGKFN